jgi:hypothetical protein
MDTMIKVLRVVPIVYLLSSCAGGHHFARVGVGEHIGNGNWIGEDDTAGILAIGWRSRPMYGCLRFDAVLDHHSQPGLGEPFNSRKESTLDSYTFGVECQW